MTKRYNVSDRKGLIGWWLFGFAAIVINAVLQGGDITQLATPEGFAILLGFSTVLTAIWFCYVEISDSNEILVTIDYTYNISIKNIDSISVRYFIGIPEIHIMNVADNGRKRDLRIARGNLALGRDFIQELIKINPEIVLDDATKRIIQS
jgi:hypothetical protein